MAEAYIIDAARTPRGIGKVGKGALTELHPGRLLAQVFEEIGNRNELAMCKDARRKFIAISLAEIR